jgi:ABC-type glucose/galactose transport system permease subunit
MDISDTTDRRERMEPPVWDGRRNAVWVWRRRASELGSYADADADAGVAVAVRLVVVFASPAMDTAGGAETKAEKSSSKPEVGAVMEMVCGAGAAVDGVGVGGGFEVVDGAHGSSIGACL